MYGSQTPRLSSTFFKGVSSADDVNVLLSAYGINLDLWQRYFLTQALLEDGNKWKYPFVGISVPRQAGKTMVLEARALAGLLLFDEQFIVIAAHEVRTTSEIFRRMCGYFESIPELKAMVKKISLRNGEEAIELKTGQRIRFMSRSGKAGRGFTADALLLDEAQELSDEAWASIIPTTMASPNAQIWLFGTPPTKENNGEVFKRIRAAGLADDPDTYFAEWSADPTADLDDEQAWLSANPAIGYRVDIEDIRGYRAALSDDAFMREILGIWNSATSKAVIDADTWQGLIVETVLDEGAPIWLSVDVTPDRTTTSVALTQVLEDGRIATVLVENREAVSWAADYIAGINSRRNVQHVVIDGGSAAGSLIDPLKARGVPVLVMGTQDVKRATGRFFDLVMDGTIAHFGDNRLNAAVAGGRKRTLQDAWAWNKATTNVDITPLVAVTNAVWATEQAPAVPAKPKKAVSHAMYSFA